MIRATGNGKCSGGFLPMTIPCDPPSAPQAAGTMKKKLIPALLGGAVGVDHLL